MIPRQLFVGKLRIALLFSILAAASPAFCQESSTSPSTSDSYPLPAQQQPSTIASSDHQISLRALPANFLTDQKEIWLYPRQLAKGKHWLPTIAVVGVTAALIATD